MHVITPEANCNKHFKQERMGWDIHSTIMDKALSKKHKKLYKKSMKRFKKAAETVKKMTGSVDGSLYDGGLDFNKSIEMLERAAGRDFHYEHGKYNPRKMKMDWSFVVEPNELRDYLSAFYFFETCYDLGLKFRMV